MTCNRSGYTLLEVTVALVIVGISMTVYLGQLSRAKAISLKSQGMMDAVRIINNVMADSELISSALEQSGDEVEVRDEVPDETEWNYVLTVTPLAISPTDSDDEPLEIDELKKITLCVSHAHAGKNYCVTRWVRGK